MASTALAALAQSCAANSGGIKRIYLANRDDIDAVTFTAEVATDIDMVTTPSLKTFFEIEFEQDTAEWREAGELVNGSSKYTQELEFFIKGNIDAHRAVLNALNNNCGFVAVVEDNNGTQFILGASSDFDLERPLKLASDATGSGKELTDLSGSTITLTAMTRNKAETCTEDMSTIV
jgi:hypothetical protein